MTNQNGQLILQALNTLEEPVTISRIVNHIADSAGVHPEDVKESIQETLNGGVRYGFVQLNKRKYFAAPVDLENMSGESNTDPNSNGDDMNKESKEDGNELEDRAARRRRKSKKSRSRSGSRKGKGKKRGRSRR